MRKRQREAVDNSDSDVPVEDGDSDEQDDSAFLAWRGGRPDKQCGTPGCTFPDFHQGACSNQLDAGPRCRKPKRPTSPEPPWVHSGRVNTAHTVKDPTAVKVNLKALKATLANAAKNDAANDAADALEHRRHKDAASTAATKTLPLDDILGPGWIVHVTRRMYQGVNRVDKTYVAPDGKRLYSMIAAQAYAEAPAAGEEASSESGSSRTTGVLTSSRASATEPRKADSKLPMLQRWRKLVAVERGVDAAVGSAAPIDWSSHELWVQCDRCHEWRSLPSSSGVDEEAVWCCEMHPDEGISSSCAVPGPATRSGRVVKPAPAVESAAAGAEAAAEAEAEVEAEVEVAGEGSAGGGCDEGAEPVARDGEALLYTVETILSERVGPKSGSREYKVSWLGWSDTHDSWESASNLHASLITHFEEDRVASAAEHQVGNGGGAGGGAASGRKQRPALQPTMLRPATWAFVADCPSVDGRGLYARKPLAAGQAICEYYGPRMPLKLQPPDGSYARTGSNTDWQRGASRVAPAAWR